jgi:hypothetical protein
VPVRGKQKLMTIDAGLVLYVFLDDLMMWRALISGSADEPGGEWILVG